MVTKISLVSANDIMNNTGVTQALFRRYQNHGLKVTFSSNNLDDLWASQQELNKQFSPVFWEAGIKVSSSKVNIDTNITTYYEDVYYLFNKVPGNKTLFKRLLKKKYPELYVELIAEELGV